MARHDKFTHRHTHGDILLMRVRTPEQKQRKREWNIANGHKPPSWLGKKHKPEAIEKMRKAKLGKKNPAVSLANKRRHQLCWIKK